MGWFADYITGKKDSELKLYEEREKLAIDKRLVDRMKEHVQSLAASEGDFHSGLKLRNIELATLDAQIDFKKQQRDYFVDQNKLELDIRVAAKDEVIKVKDEQIKLLQEQITVLLGKLTEINIKDVHLHTNVDVASQK